MRRSRGRWGSKSVWVNETWHGGSGSFHYIIGDAGTIRNMKNRRQIEREFGVPIAGAILDQASWTQTALKKLPPTGPLDLGALFGRDAPLVVDLGCGNGRFLIRSA